jgi:hypothetical protein
MLQQLLRYQPKGRRPWLQVLIDLTTLEKCGKFTAFKHLIHVLHGKRGLHLVVLYLVVGPFRFPWGFRVWRGKNSQTPVQLALRLIDSLPALPDSGISGDDFSRYGKWPCTFPQGRAFIVVMPRLLEYAVTAS